MLSHLFGREGAISRIIYALQQHSSAPSIGFAGVSGLVVSAIIDIASAIKPMIPGLLVVSALAVTALGFLIFRGTLSEDAGEQASGRMRLYCQSMLVAVGSGFGALMLIITANIINNDDGSTLMALSDQIASGFQRIEEQVDDVARQVEGVGKQVGSMSDVVRVRDISGLSGTGMIGDAVAFKISLTDSSSMSDRICKLHIDEPWSQQIETIDTACERYTVRLPKTPRLNEDGSFSEAIISIPYKITVQDKDGTMIGSFSEVYIFNNNYRDLQLGLRPPGNRLTLNDKRKLSVQAMGEPIPSGLECDVSVYDGLHYEPTKENKCEGWLLTATDPNDYHYKRIMKEGEIRSSLSVQVISAADFQMIGIKLIDLAIRKYE
jgi:hypothetical protein